jgi:hypothetical protein
LKDTGVYIIATGVSNEVTQLEALAIASAGDGAIVTGNFEELIGTLALVGSSMCRENRGMPIYLCDRFL